MDYEFFIVFEDMEMGKNDFPFRLDTFMMQSNNLYLDALINKTLIPEIFYNSKGEMIIAKNKSNKSKFQSKMLLPTFIPIVWTDVLPKNIIFHMHNFSEITQVKSGTALYIVNNTCIEVKKGDIIIFNGNIPHAWFPYNLDPPIIKVANINSSQLLLQNLTEERYGYLNKLFSNEFPFFYYKADSQIAKIISILLDDISLEYKNEMLGFEIMIKSKVLEIYTHILRCTSFEDNKKHSFTSTRFGNSEMNKAINYINSNYLNDITLSDISKHISISESYFSKIFKKNMGLSPIYYVNRLRISKAVEFLTSTYLNITEISESCGFSSISAFYRAFVSVHKMSPKQYKQNLEMRNPL